MKWKRRCKGAISIFLVIIFLASYLFAGLLVDGGRAKMAQAMAESALDSATSSVLSYYNQLLFDLYGLFATDSLSEEKVNELLTSYVEKTVGTAEIDTAGAKALVDTIVSSITGEDDPASAQSFDGYDFETAVTAKSTTTLANTAYVEYQMIEHMKYRAPVALAGEAGGFLEDLQGVVAMGDRIKAAQEKLKITNSADKKALATDAEALMVAIESYNQKLWKFTVDPVDFNVGSTFDASRSHKDPSDYVTEYDDAMDEAGNAVYPFPGEDGAEPTDEAVDAWYRDAYDDLGETLTDSFGSIAQNAEDLHTEANSLRDRMERILARYDSYISQLKSAYDANASNENYKTVYLPEIEMAESYCGELVKNMALVLNSRAYTDQIAASGTEYDTFFTGAAALSADERLGIESGENRTVRLSSMIDAGGGNVFISGCRTALSELDAALASLSGLSHDFLEGKPPKIATVEDANANGAKAKAELEENVDKTDLRDLNKDDLAMDFTVVDSPGDFTTADVMDPNKTDEILTTGLNLITKLGDFLESGRDNLYLNEYAVAYFPNYVQNHHAKAPLTADYGPSVKKLSEGGEYAPYCATQAELEYILTGKDKTFDSVNDVKGRLLGIRTVFNLAAIFTDSAKVTQANALAAAISGPFAPLVSIGLLTAWALAESVIDVEALVAGEDVFLFKQGANWTLSVGGAFKGAIDSAANYLVGEAAKKLKGAVSELTGKATAAANQAVYAAYNAAESGTAAIKAAAGGVLNDWSDNIREDVSSLSGTGITQEGKDAVLGVATEIPQLFGAQLDAQLGGALPGKDAAISAISSAANKMETKINSAIEDKSGQLTDQLVGAVAGRVSKLIPKGQVVNTGDNDATTSKGIAVKLGYMDYMRIFLLFMDGTTKVQRMQQLIQANLRYAEGEGSKAFTMAGSFASIEASMDCSISFLFMSQALVPPSIRQDGRLSFTVNSNLSY